jgi:hypothetical protein
MRIAHYTIAKHAATIIETGYLKLTPDKSQLRGKEIPLVWFSSNMDGYPPTAIKPVVVNGALVEIGLAQFEEIAGPLYRFVCSSNSVVAKPWPLIRKISRMRVDLRKKLVRTAKMKNESPGHWWATTKVVSTDLLTLEKLVNGQWIACSDDDPSQSGGDVQVIRESEANRLFSE